MADLAAITLQLADELDTMRKTWCWRNTPGPCTNPDCVRRRNLANTARELAAEHADRVAYAQAHIAEQQAQIRRLASGRPTLIARTQEQ